VVSSEAVKQENGRNETRLTFGDRSIADSETKRIVLDSFGNIFLQQQSEQERSRHSRGYVLDEERDGTRQFEFRRREKESGKRETTHRSRTGSIPSSLNINRRLRASERSRLDPDVVEAV